MQTAATTRTNLVTNPGFEVDASSWSAYLGTISRVTSDHFYGTAALQLVTTAIGGQTYISNTTTSGNSYAFQCMVKGTAGDQIFIQGYDGTSSQGYQQYTATGSWQLINTIFASVTSSIQFQVGGKASGQTILIDAVLCERGTTLQPFFDGSFGNGYYWTGSPQLSTSYYKQLVAAQSAPSRTPTQGVLISWDKITASGVKYFGIGTSAIGSSDIIKSGGGSPAFSDQYSYKDYSKYVTSWSVTKKLGQYPYGIILSQANITLNNASNMFTSASGTSLSPLAPNIRTGRPVKISAGFNNETLSQFVGYTDTPVFDISSRTVQLHCFDAIDYLNGYISASPTQLNKTADVIIQTLLQEAGFSASQFVLEASLQKAIAVLAPHHQSIGSIIQNLCEAEGALFFCDENGIMRFWNRQHFSNNASPVARLTYSNSEGYTEQDTPIINYVSVTSNPLTVSGTHQLYSNSLMQYIPANGYSGTNNVTNPSFEYGTTGWTGVTQVTPGYIGTHAASGTVLQYGGVNTTGVSTAYKFSFAVKTGNTAAYNTSIIGQDTVGNPVTVAAAGSTGTGSWITQAYTFNNTVAPYLSPKYPAYLTVSGSAPLLLDAVTSDTTHSYYDGDSGSSSATKYAWQGTPGNSITTAIPIVSPTVVTSSFSSPVLSAITPIANALTSSSFTANTAADGSGTDISASLTVSVVVNGYDINVYFLNTSQTQGYITNLIVYGTSAYSQSAIIQSTNVNQVSINNYKLNPANGSQVLAINNNYIQDSGSAAALAYTLVNNYSSANMSISIRTFANPQLQFGDLVQFANRETGETRLLYIVGITNSLGANGDYRQDLTLEERAIYKYFGIGTSAIASTDQISP